MPPTYFHVFYDNEEMRAAGVAPWKVVTTQLDTALDHLRALLDGTDGTEGGPFDSISVSILRQDTEVPAEVPEPVIHESDSSAARGEGGPGNYVSPDLSCAERAAEWSAERRLVWDRPSQ